MHRPGTMIEKKVNIYTANLANKSSPQKPVHSNEWRISETSLVPTVSAICGIKPKHSRLKPIKACEEFATTW
jgi:hypothetical protein